MSAKLIVPNESLNAFYRKLNLEKKPERRFTLGAYRDLKHFAESANITETGQEAAAKAAGFESASRIGPYLRTLIVSHHDTLAASVK